MRNNNFDFLRFYFAFIVLIAHLIVLSGVGSLQKLLPYFSSYISVTAFFIISGFLITNSYLRSGSLKSYFKKRAARLLPAYLVVIILSSFCFSVFSTYSPTEYFTNPQFYKYLLANLTFQNYIEPCLPGVFLSKTPTCVVNAALWTLKIEVAFYITLPIIIAIIGKLKRRFLVLISIYILSVVYKAMFEYLGYYLQIDMLTFLSRQLPGFLSYFIAGMLIYFSVDLFHKYKTILFFFGLIVFVVERHFGLELLSPFALALIVFYVAFSFDWLNNFAKHGDISYGIYIYHFPIMNVAVEMGLFQYFNPLFALLIVIVCIFMISYFSWHFLESKILKKVRGLQN